MSTILLWRPLTFWDEEQILEIKKQWIVWIIQEDVDISDYQKEIRSLQSKVEDMESMIDNYYRDLESEVKNVYWSNKFLKQYSFQEVRDFIFKSI